MRQFLGNFQTLCLIALMLLSFSLLAWRIVVRQIDKCIMLLNACCWRILENCDCFISLYAPLSLKYVWSSADGVFNGEKIWSVVLCICLIQNYYAQCSKIIVESLIQLCERSELCLHFEWTKLNFKCQKSQFWRFFENLKLAFKLCYQAYHF